MLPKGREGETILGIIESAMPDVKVNLNFDYGHLKHKLKRSNHEDSLATFLKNARAGNYYKDRICKRLKMTSRTFEKLIATADNDAGSVLAQAMEQYRITYHAGSGRYDKSFFMKMGR
jgi:hypothetical protein